MAGRILPVALAAILGISITVATFDGEFKEQRKKRMDEEYKREVAAVAASNSANSSLTASSVSASDPRSSPISTPPPPPNNQIERPSPAHAPSWSSLFGLWAWNKDPKHMEISTSRPVSGTNNDARGNP